MFFESMYLTDQAFKIACELCDAEGYTTRQKVAEVLSSREKRTAEEVASKVDYVFDLLCNNSAVRFVETPDGRLKRAPKYHPHAH